MISKEIINRMGVTRGTSTFPNGNGKFRESSKTRVVEEGVIGDELAGGPMSVHKRRV